MRPVARFEFSGNATSQHMKSDYRHIDVIDGSFVTYDCQPRNIRVTGNAENLAILAHPFGDQNNGP